MRKILIIITMLMTIITMGQTQLYKGFTEGMTTSEAMRELKKNKKRYKDIDFGKGIKWQVFKNKGSFVADDNSLVGVHFIGNDYYGQGFTGQAGFLALEQTANVLLEKGYEVYLENEDWKYPHYWERNNYAYGLMLLSPDKTKVVHLYYTGTSIMATMTIKSLTQIEKEFKESKEDQSETASDLEGF
jgi:hypothetical protein